MYTMYLYYITQINRLNQSISSGYETYSTGSATYSTGSATYEDSTEVVTYIM